MIIFKILIFLLAMFSGTVFSLFLLTFIESRSKGFQSFIGRIHNLVPKTIWTFLVLVSIAAFGAFFFFSVADYARAGIFAGLVVGIFVCFRAGPNINYKDMEKAGNEYVKEQTEKRNRRMNGGRKKYVGASPKPVGKSGKSGKPGKAAAKPSKAAAKSGKSGKSAAKEAAKSSRPKRLK